MPRVEVYRLKKGGSQEMIAKFSLVGDLAVGEGNERFVKRLEREGVLDKTKKPPTKVFPADGQRFLQSLKSNFTSGYLAASEVLEGEPGT